MVHKRMPRIARTLAASTLLALAAHAQAQPNVVWVDNESFGFTNCAGVDVLPGSQDPKELMAALRERGLADAGRMARARGFGEGTLTLTPMSGSIRCEGTTSAVVFRVALHEGASGRTWSSNLVSRLPASGMPTSGLRSTR
jgi:hypothetical protein